MRVVDLIRRKRDGEEHSSEEIRTLIDGYTRGDIPDYQMSAWLMAAFLRGLSGAETAALTSAMLHSGKVLDFSDVPGRKVDKHSTGGVGDKTSLIVAPIAAAAGVRVPMISGRGLGHTGGTLDKLESIPGFNVNLSLAEFRHALETVGCGLIGQTAEIAPADKKMYALRDVTGTVEHRSLICASIMSKKLAEGLDALVLDVKVGSGAFLKTEADATLLAELMVETGRRMGKQVVALLTDMDQPLGRMAGNAMEIAESLAVLSGAGPDDLRELCLALSAWMLLLGERVKTIEEGKRVAADLIVSGRAREKFREIIKQQGGDARVVDDPKRLARATHTLDVVSGADGYVSATQCEQLGVACVVLGGGREKKEDAIDPAVGLVFHKRIGDGVRRGEPLCTLHYNSDARLDEARRLVETAYKISPRPPAAGRALVGRVIGG
ncbi:MAG: thymidine phosphorylase [Candidatus Acidiferrales bacterium]|jgi:pyrimidine-nucleoside phosphorylase